MKYNTLFFDWDGNLARTLEAWLNAVRGTYPDFSLTPPSDKDIALCFGDWKSALRFGVKPDDLEEFNNSMTDRALRSLSKVELYPGVKEALKRISNFSVKKILVTSSRRRVLESVLRLHGLDGYFDSVITAEDVEEHKPNPECLHLGLSRLGLTVVTAGKMAIIGDTEKDINTANAIGIDSYLFLPEENAGFYDFEELTKIKHTASFSSWDDMPTILE